MLATENLETETVRPSDTKAGDSKQARGARLDSALKEWTQTLASNPRKGKLVFSAEGETFETLATRLQAGKHSFVADEPPALGGDNLGPNPVEFALAGLIGCQAVTYRVWARKLGIAVDSVKIHAEGDLDVRGFFGLDDSVRPGFSGIRVTVTVSGPERQERYRELQEAVERHCPVSDLFSNSTPVSTSLAIA